MNAICYDSANRPIKELTQWDTNRKIVITGVEVESAPVIHFYNTKSERALVVSSEFNNGSITVPIPNLLLQSCLPLFISIYTENDNDEGKTIGTICIPIIPKKKPEDYEYVENIEYVSWVKLEQEAKVLLKELESFRDELDNKVDSEELDNLYKAEDGQSIIIGDEESNTAGTKGFRIFKAQRVTQNDGGYHYFYYLAGATDELLAQFKEVLTANPNAKYTLRNYYITNSFTLNKEYTDDQAETYEVTKEDNYLKVRVGDVKRTFQPIPEDPGGVPLDGIKDENGNYRYVWKPTADSNVYEMDFTDTWDYKGKTEYSYFRLAVVPDLGTEWLETNSLVAGGSNNKALGKDSFTAGSDNISNGSKAVTLGDENYANYSALAAGKQNKALNKYDVALGYKNEVDAFAGFGAGNANEVKHSFSAAIGNNLKTQNGNQILLGRYNKNTHDKNVVLSVGAGWDEASRRDAMTIFYDGEVRTLGKVVAAGVDLNAEIASAQKDIDNLKNVLETVNERTTLKLGELPITGEVDKLYIVEKDDNVEQYVYKVRKTPKVENVWNGEISTTQPYTLQGSGTEADPFQITNGNELYYIIYNTHNYHCKLMNDIYLNDISNPNWKDKANEWIPCDSKRSFSGVFDGCNHTIYGLYYNNPTDADSANSYIGSALFPFIKNEFSTTPIVIKNLGLDYAYVSSSSNAGALVGVTQSANYEISNCWVGENVELLGHYVASISTWGNGKALIENCYSLATQNNIYGATRNAFAQANFWIYNPTGAGQVTDNLATIKNCYCLNGKLTYSPSNLQTVENCYCTAEGGWGTVINKEDMIGIKALDNMSELNSYIEGSKQAVGKNKLEYPYTYLPIGETVIGDVWKATANADGSVTVVVNRAGSEVIVVDIPVSKILYDLNGLDYVTDGNILVNEGTVGDDNIYYYRTAFDANFPGGTFTIYPQVELGTTATEWEEPIIVETVSGYNYVNDYTYPHLTSFIKGWKLINESKCEVTKEEFDKTIGNINSILATLVEGSVE